MINNSAITELKELLEKAAVICENNIEQAENIDLHSMMETLEEYVDELNAIENFEVYDDFKTFNEAPYGEDADMEAQDYNTFGNNKI
jgi:hypothetical protein